MINNQIELLSNETIDKIAAGEVVERPYNVVKELVENAIDAGSSAITVEIKGGGSELIRVTDNGCGIEKSECRKAFLRHATSKLRTIDDLQTLISLGFRGEALSSISAVSKTEMITKREADLLGSHIVVEGGRITEENEIGAPNGTTILVRTLFYNTPARKKFLKSPTAEGAMISDMLEKFALSHPFVSFNLISNGKSVLSTSGNGSLKDTVFQIYGKDIYSSLLEISYESYGISIKGYCSSPSFSYQSRNGELYFVNERYVRSKIINSAIEDVYKKYLMQHRFPFCVFDINVSPDTIDINVHPQKLEVKFSDGERIYNVIHDALVSALNNKELIPEVKFNDFEPIPNIIKESEVIYNPNPFIVPTNNNDSDLNTFQEPKRAPEPFELKRKETFNYETLSKPIEENLFEKKLITDEDYKKYNIIGQVFETYWIISLEDDLYIVDQHAAHEKVNYEKFVSWYENDTTVAGQLIVPPVALHLSAKESEALLQNLLIFEKIGFEIEEFGINSFAIRQIPLNLFGINEDELFRRLLDEIIEKEGSVSPSFVYEKLASLSCKAAIKGGQKISFVEMENLMKQLMKLENPYNCPHGRPVFIKITKNELEKKFKRIL